jgi:5-methylcytosine-specific restriction endonuclease McrA
VNYNPAYHATIKFHRERARRRQRNRCHWCKKPMAAASLCLPNSVSAEHLVAVGDGGHPLDPKNIVAACVKCNSSRPSEALTRHNLEMQKRAQAERERSKTGMVR